MCRPSIPCTAPRPLTTDVEGSVPMGVVPQLCSAVERRPRIQSSRASSSRPPSSDGYSGRTPICRSGSLASRAAASRAATRKRARSPGVRRYLKSSRGIPPLSSNSWPGCSVRSAETSTLRLVSPVSLSSRRPMGRSTESTSTSPGTSSALVPGSQRLEPCTTTPSVVSVGWSSTSVGTRKRSSSCGWSCSCAPTGRSRTTVAPAARTAPGGPTPLCTSSCGVAMAPAHNTTRSALMASTASSTTISTPVVCPPRLKRTRVTVHPPRMVSPEVGGSSQARAVLQRCPSRVFVGNAPTPGGGSGLAFWSGTNGRPSSTPAVSSAALSGWSRELRVMGIGPEPRCPYSRSPSISAQSGRVAEALQRWSAATAAQLSRSRLRGRLK